MNALPPSFIERLSKILTQKDYALCLRSFSEVKPAVIRINTLKTSRRLIEEICMAQRINYSTFTNSQVAQYESLNNVLIIDQQDIQRLDALGLFKDGRIYRQGISSILVACILNPKPGERILDLCAAPGSKATLISAMMNNEGELDCIDYVKKRFYRLKSVISLLGATNIDVKLVDGKRFRLKEEEPYDKILVDAPCSSEGRFHLQYKKSWAYWSQRKIKEMRSKQKGLLLNAMRLLKPNGRLVYSTCTFAPEENEDVIDWLIRKSSKLNGKWSFGLKVMPINLKDVSEKILNYPPLKQWGKKTFDPQIKNCLRILPNEVLSGFFIAKLKKL